MRGKTEDAPGDFHPVVMEYPQMHGNGEIAEKQSGQEQYNSGSGKILPCQQLSPKLQNNADLQHSLPEGSAFGSKVFKGLNDAVIMAEHFIHGASVEVT